jgi:hypothetical protein
MAPLGRAGRRFFRSQLFQRRTCAGSTGSTCSPIYSGNGALLKFHRIEVVLAIQLTMVTLALNRIAMFNKKQDLS